MPCCLKNFTLWRRLDEVTVTQTDPAGNTSTGNGANFMLDLTLLRVTSAEHGFELDNTKPTITGFGAPGASVEVFGS